MQRISRNTISSSIEAIGDHCCFEQTEITELTIPTTVKMIGKGTFGNCIYLNTINIDSVSFAIREDAFEGCNQLSSLTKTGYVTEISAGAFSKTVFLYFVRTDCEAVRQYFSELNVQVAGIDEIVLLPRIPVDSDEP